MQKTKAYPNHLAYLLISSFLLLYPFLVFSQGLTIKGVIQDASTKETLPAANISIEGTYSGTISNSDGQFVIGIKIIPSTLIFRYIGYETQKVTISDQSQKNLTIQMNPIAYTMEDVIVTGEDPAVRIMREVIEKKQIWRKQLKTYKAEAYSRQLIENDTGIVSINESISTAFWHYEDGPREIIRSKRQTNNMLAENNFAASSYVPNFYDDNIEISGFNMIGVTNPKALKAYDFKLEGYRKLDDKIVFDISVKPKSKLESAFKGKIAVLNEDMALLEVDLVPSESMLFPPPINEFNLHYKQQFNNFGTEFWLPVDMRIEGTISIGMMGFKIPSITFNQTSKLSEYDVNITLPDSLYGYQRLLVVDSISVNKNTDSLFAIRSDLIVLSKEEEQAYNTIDSTMTLDKAFKPTGFLARMIDDDDDNERKKKKGPVGKAVDKFFNFVTPEVWYSRVEGGHLGADVHHTFKDIKFAIRGGYKTNAEQYGYGFYTEYNQPNRSGLYSKIYFDDDVALRNPSPYFSRLMNSGTFIMGGRDYFDYYWSTKAGIELAYKFALIKFKRRNSINANIALGFQIEDSRSLSNLTNYDIFARQYINRLNPTVFNGSINSLKAKIALGDDFLPVPVTALRRLSFTIEHANSSIFQSDINFTTFLMEWDYRFDTFFQRRFIPNNLDIRVIAGTSLGNVPLQRLHTIHGSLTGYTPFGTLRGLNNSFYQGESLVGLFWEHNFRTVPFELIGLQSVAKKGISIIAFGGHSKTWLSDSFQNALNPYEYAINSSYHELGFSVSGLFDFLRVDFVQRIDRPQFYVGFGVARIL